jgi:hypothetical protein
MHVGLGCLAWMWLCAGSAHAQPLVALGDVVEFGVYADGVPYFSRALKDLERNDKLGDKLDVVSGFVDWDYVFGEARDRALSGKAGRKLLYSWEPQCKSKTSCISFTEITSGHQDAYLQRIADSMSTYPHEIYVRPWAEMNAWWSPYQPGSKQPLAGSIEEFKAAWRYVYTFFRSRGVRNLHFVFNPDASMEPTNVDVREIWPGAQYVEVLGIDGYNWGDSGSAGGERWQEFDDIFRDMYGVLTALDETAPVWICEFGSKEPAKSDGGPENPSPRDPTHSKATWLHGMFGSTAFPRVSLLAYYSAYNQGHKVRDFRLDSSKASLRAIRAFLRAHSARAIRR